MQVTTNTKGREEPSALPTCWDEEGFLGAVAPSIDLAGELDALEDILKERIASNEQLSDIVGELFELHRFDIFQEMLLKLLSIISDSEKPKLEIDTLIIASGLPLHSVTLTELAKRHGITKQALSVRCRNMIARLGLKRPRTLKSQEAVETYRLTNRRNNK